MGLWVQEHLQVLEPLLSHLLQTIHHFQGLLPLLDFLLDPQVLLIRVHLDPQMHHQGQRDPGLQNIQCLLDPQHFLWGLLAHQGRLPLMLQVNL